MPKFFDTLSGETREMVDWLDKTGSKARGREARARENSSVKSGLPGANTRPGLGTSYTIGSYRGCGSNSAPKRVTKILDESEFWLS